MRLLGWTSSLALTLALGLATGAHAEATPPRGNHDARVRVAAYVDGEVYRIATTLLNVTTIGRLWSAQREHRLQPVRDGPWGRRTRADAVGRQARGAELTCERRAAALP